VAYNVMEWNIGNDVMSINLRSDRAVSGRAEEEDSSLSHLTTAMAIWDVTE